MLAEILLAHQQRVLRYMTCLAAIICSVPASSASIDDACKPSVFLTVAGNIGKFSDDSARTFELSEADILALPKTTLITSTEWTSRSVFEGPLLSAILQRVEARGTKLRFVAFDDFAAETDTADVGRYKPIVAYKKDGTRLTARDFGPLFVVYPRDEFPDELGASEATAKYVWQLCKIIVE